MTKLAGQDHEYGSFGTAVNELREALAQAPSNPSQWYEGFQVRYRGILGDPRWMKTGTGSREGEPAQTLGSMVESFERSLAS